MARVDNLTTEDMVIVLKHQMESIMQLKAFCAGAGSGEYKDLCDTIKNNIAWVNRGLIRLNEMAAEDAVTIDRGSE